MSIFQPISGLASLARGAALGLLLAAAPAVAQSQSDNGDGENGGSEAVKAQLRQGSALFREGRAEDAVALWRPLAEQGNPGAQVNLAQAYRLGEGVAPNRDRARDLARRSALQGHPMGQTVYGLLLYDNAGDDLARKREGVNWWHAAASRGLAQAQYRYAVALWQGEAVDENRVDALAWMMIAQENGQPQAGKAIAAMRAALTEERKALAANRVTQIREQGAAPMPTPAPKDTGKRDTPSPVTADKDVMAEAPSAQRGTEDTEDQDEAPSGRVATTASAESPAPREQTTAPRTQAPTSPQTEANASDAAQNAPQNARQQSGQPPEASEQEAEREEARPDVTQGWQVQLLALTKESGAQAQASLLRADLADVLGEARIAVVQASISGRGTVYRLRAGPYPDRAAAKRACQAFQAAGQDCYVVSPAS